MIDPKLNELVDTSTKTGSGKLSETDATAGQTSTSAKPRPGLSINDTIAADANLSVGARGADTSGVRAGAGAGAGNSFVTPGTAGESPAPNVLPGGRGSGTTPVSDSGADLATGPNEKLTGRAASSESYSSGSLGSGANSEVSYDDIAAHAYRCWHERGCPSGSPEEDWHRAERELRERAIGPKTSTASA